MQNTYTAVFQQSGEWWLGRVEEVPGALAQERTLDEARESLRAALVDVLEVQREAARETVPEGAIRELMCVPA